MRLKSLALIIGLSASYSASANTVHCGLSENSSQCETVTLIDFNGDQLIENESKQFSDWQETLQDGYTGSEGEVSYMVVGSNASYNYQGIKGATGNYFKEGEFVTVTFSNPTDSTVVFSPRISFDDVDRQISGEAGVWSTMGDYTLVPNDDLTAHFYIGFASHGRFNSVNVQINESANRGIGVDKIEYTRHIDEAEAVYLCEYNTVDCKTYELMEFGGTLDSMRAKGQLIGFNEPLMGSYTELGTYGLGVEAQNTVKDQYLNAGVQSLDGTHEFKVGEIIEFDVSNTSNQDYVLKPKFSFTDPNNHKYGGEPVEAWFDISDEIILAGDRITLKAVITQEMAGNHSMINFMPIIDNVESTSDNLAIMSIRYVTAQDFQAKILAK